MSFSCSKAFIDSDIVPYFGVGLLEVPTKDQLECPTAQTDELRSLGSGHARRRQGAGLQRHHVCDGGASGDRLHLQLLHQGGR